MMKLSVIVACVFLAGCARPTEPKENTKAIFANTLTKRLEKALPVGWGLQIDSRPGRHAIIISKDAPVKVYYVGPSAKPSAGFEDLQYYICITSADYIAPDEYQAAHRKNEDLKKECQKLFQTIPHQKSKCPFWQYEFRPRNPKEEKIVKKLKSIRQMPQYHLDGRGYRILSYDSLYLFEKEAEKDECQKVTRQVKSVFLSYITRGMELIEQSHARDSSKAADGLTETRDE